MMMIDTIVIGCRIDGRSLLNSNERPTRLIVGYSATRVTTYPKASDLENTMEWLPLVPLRPVSVGPL